MSTTNTLIDKIMKIDGLMDSNIDIYKRTRARAQSLTRPNTHYVNDQLILISVADQFAVTPFIRAIGRFCCSIDSLLVSDNENPVSTSSICLSSCRPSSESIGNVTHAMHKLMCQCM